MRNIYRAQRKYALRAVRKNRMPDARIKLLNGYGARQVKSSLFGSFSVHPCVKVYFLRCEATCLFWLPPPHANMRVRPDIMRSGAKTRALRVAWRNESALVFSSPVCRVCNPRIRRICRTAAKAANRYIRISPFHTCCKRAETRLSALPLLSA